MRNNFSIIIPHKDIPDLLQRCLDSIPVRDDVQVIVVDDNSDPRKVDFGEFPRWKGGQYEYYLSKEGKGAGHARNVGLEHAIGRWVVFADADDFFTEDFNDLLEEVVDKEQDMIYFDYINVLSDDIKKPVKERIWYSRSMAAFRNGKCSETSLKTSIPVVWCRLVKRDLIERHRIRFNETRWSNDVFFAAQVSCFAKSIGVNARKAYALTQRYGSLTDQVCGTMQETRVRLVEGLKCENLYKSYGIQAKGTQTSPHLWFVAKNKGFWWCIRFCIANVATNLPVAKAMFVFLAKRLKRGDCDWKKNAKK